MADVFYSDFLNLGHNNRVNITGTKRLYTQSHGELQDLILVSPLVSMSPFVAINEWSAGEASLADSFMTGLQQADANVGKLADTLKKNLNGVIGAFTIRDNMTEAQKQRALGTSSNKDTMQVINPSDHTKSYTGTSIQVPTELSVTYFSSPDSYKWYGTIEGKSISSNTPLKDMCGDLAARLVGKIEVSTGEHSCKMYAPNNFGTSPSQWTKYVQGSLTLRIGDKITIPGLLPASLQIIPSKLITTTGDYYYVTISIGFTPGRLVNSAEYHSWVSGANQQTLENSLANEGNKSKAAETVVRKEG